MSRYLHFIQTDPRGLTLEPKQMIHRHCLIFRLDFKPLLCIVRTEIVMVCISEILHHLGVSLSEYLDG